MAEEPERVTSMEEFEALYGPDPTPAILAEVEMVEAMRQLDGLHLPYIPPRRPAPLRRIEERTRQARLPDLLGWLLRAAKRLTNRRKESP